MRRVRLTMVLSVIALVAAGVVVGHVMAQSGGATAVRAPLAQSTKVKGAKGETLGLSRVTIPAGGTIALHHHEARRSPTSSPDSSPTWSSRARSP
jgi:hypothetical protein